MADLRMLVVTYELGNPPVGPGVGAQIEQILSSSEGWMHHLGTTWVIVTKETPRSLTDKIAPLLGQQGRLLVFEVKQKYSGWLAKSGWEWLRKSFDYLAQQKDN